MIDREQQCPLFESCNCKSAVCRVSLPDKNCWYYRWFRDLIEEDNYRNKVMCPNCKEEMYCSLDMTIHTPWHFHCKKCDIDVGCEDNVRAILRCCFSQSREDLIETATKAIMSIRQEPVVVNPVNPQTVPLPYRPCPDISSPNVTPYITCTGTAEDLKNFQNSNIIDKEK